MTSEEDVRQAVKYNIDALGFIITDRDHPSKIDLTQATKLISLVPDHILPVLCVGNLPIADIIDSCQTTKVKVLQLQRSGTIKEIQTIKDSLRHIKIWKVFYTEAAPNLAIIKEFEALVDAIMIHSREEEWEKALQIAKALKKPLIVAGSLNVGNVERAIKLFHPNMVDVIRGVETCPGKKDFQKVAQFIEAVIAT